MRITTALLLFFTVSLEAKEIALTFDDAPAVSTEYFSSLARTKTLIKSLSELNVPPVMIFANPCRGETEEAAIQQLELYRSAGHLVANHTCSHPRLNDVGFDTFTKDTLKADQLLTDLQVGQKFFRFPYLNEGQLELRNQMRVWLKQNGYRHGMVSLDNDDYLVSFKMNEARKLGRKIDYQKIQSIFLDHILGAVEFYDNLAVKTLGSSPKHVLLLHERDATVMFIAPLVNELRKRGWNIISAADAFTDPLYSEEPQNTYANNGIVAQVHFEKTGSKLGFFDFENLEGALNSALNLE
jgi:peptidoglycan/xylan/chitin deacetylase (PgdA/CDA1 family)